jgi:hypothetical protein
MTSSRGCMLAHLTTWQPRGALCGTCPQYLVCHGSLIPRNHRSLNQYPLKEEPFPHSLHLVCLLRCKIYMRSWSNHRTLSLPNYSYATRFRNRRALHFLYLLRKVVVDVAAHMRAKVSSNLGVYGTGSCWHRCNPSSLSSHFEINDSRR